MLHLKYGLLHIICRNYCTLFGLSTQYKIQRRETKRPEFCYWLRVSDTQSEELNSLMATGRNDFLWRSVVHRGGISLALNVLLWLTTTSWSGWEPLSKMTCNLDSIFLSDTAVRESSSTTRNVTGLAHQSVRAFAAATLPYKGIRKIWYLYAGWCSCIHRIYTETHGYQTVQQKHLIVQYSPETINCTGNLMMRNDPEHIFLLCSI